MSSTPKFRSVVTLILGDVLVLLAVTIFGFATHQTLESAGSRILTTFIPLCLAWLLVGYFGDVFSLDRAIDWHQLWRPFLGMVLAAPMATFFRALSLGNAPIQPLFIIVLGGFSALALLAWRAIFSWLARGKE